jgi:hypothetical protein
LELLLLGAETNDIAKSLESGPTDGLGTDLVLSTWIIGLGANPDPDEFDDGIIGIGLPVKQHYIFSINIGDSADVPEGTVIYDVIPAEYNLDPDAEDFENGGTDATCDDADCDGIEVSAGNCTATERQPPNSQGGRFKEPELLTIIVGSDETCTVLVYVETDGNPGHFVSPGPPPVFTLYEPTSCLAFRDDGDVLLGDTDNGDPIVDSIALNDGFKDFDPETGDRISGPRGSLQLTPIGCDSDDDGVIDELDMCPLDDGGGEVEADGCPD